MPLGNQKEESEGRISERRRESDWQCSGVRRDSNQGRTRGDSDRQRRSWRTPSIFWSLYMRRKTHFESWNTQARERGREGYIEKSNQLLDRFRFHGAGRAAAVLFLHRPNPANPKREKEREFRRGRVKKIIIYRSLGKLARTDKW